MADPNDLKRPTSRMARIETALEGEDEFSVGDKKRPKPVELKPPTPEPEAPRHGQTLLHRLRQRFFR